MKYCLLVSYKKDVFNLPEMEFSHTPAVLCLQGAQEMLQNLPYELVSPEHLEKVAQHGGRWQHLSVVCRLIDAITDEDIM